MLLVKSRMKQCRECSTDSKIWLGNSCKDHIAHRWE